MVLFVLDVIVKYQRESLNYFGYGRVYLFLSRLLLRVIRQNSCKVVINLISQLVIWDCIGNVLKFTEQVRPVNPSIILGQNVSGRQNDIVIMVIGKLVGLSLPALHVVAKTNLRDRNGLSQVGRYIISGKLLRILQQVFLN